MHPHRYKLINPLQEAAVASCRRFRSKIKGHFLVERFFDWTIKPKSGCHAEEYSRVCGLERKADPRIASLVQNCQNVLWTLKKTEHICVIQLCEMLLFTRPSLLLFLVSFCLGLESFHPLEDKPIDQIMKLHLCSYKSHHQVATLCLPCLSFGW